MVTGRPLGGPKKGPVAVGREPQTRALLRSKLDGRNEVIDAMIGSLEGHLRVPVGHVQAIYRALSAAGVYRELVAESGWTPEQFAHWVGEELLWYLADDA